MESSHHNHLKHVSQGFILSTNFVDKFNFIQIVFFINTIIFAFILYKLIEPLFSVFPVLFIHSVDWDEFFKNHKILYLQT